MSTVYRRIALAALAVLVIAGAAAVLFVKVPNENTGTAITVVQNAGVHPGSQVGPAWKTIPAGTRMVSS